MKQRLKHLEPNPATRLVPRPRHRAIPEKVRPQQGLNRERARMRRWKRKPRLQFEWTKAIEAEQWAVYQAAIQAMRDGGIRFLVGGGFALAVYTGRWRNTKDIDFYILDQDQQAAKDVLTQAGFEDYFPQLSYDRNWIYRSTRSGVIVDVIRAMANQRARPDELWFERAPTVTMRRETLQVLPIEEFIWCKLYILQRDHCDWTDILNVIYACGTRINWSHLLWRLEDDWPLLKALLTVYSWMCPRRARQLPALLKRRLRFLEPPIADRSSRHNRIRLLDSRGWFAATLPKDRPLEV